MTQVLNQFGRRIGEAFSEFRATLRWMGVQLRNWWMGSDGLARREAQQRRLRKQRQRQILRRLRGLA